MILPHLYFSSGTEKRHGIHVMHLQPSCSGPGLSSCVRDDCATNNCKHWATPTHLDGFSLCYAV